MVKAILKAIKSFLVLENRFGLKVQLPTISKHFVYIGPSIRTNYLQKIIWVKSRFSSNIVLTASFYFALFSLRLFYYFF